MFKPITRAVFRESEINFLILCWDMFLKLKIMFRLYQLFKMNFQRNGLPKRERLSKNNFKGVYFLHYITKTVLRVTTTQQHFK